jgi:hypothetical protein
MEWQVKKSNPDAERTVINKIFKEIEAAINDLRPGIQGPIGPTGATGPTGPTGPTGATGPTGP